VIGDDIAVSLCLHNSTHEPPSILSGLTGSSVTGLFNTVIGYSAGYNVAAFKGDHKTWYSSWYEEIKDEIDSWLGSYKKLQQEIDSKW
jgi:hypothetical protein